MDYRQLPGSVASYPYMSEPEGEGRTGRIWGSDICWIPGVGAYVLYRLLSRNDYRVTKVAYYDVAPVKRDPPAGNTRLAKSACLGRFRLRRSEGTPPT